MEVPILKQNDILIASVQAELTDRDLLTLQEDLTEKVGKLRSMGVIIDVTVLDVMDSFTSRILRDMAQALKLRGADTVIVGIQPEVAFAMSELGLTIRFRGIETALDLEEGLRLLAIKTERF